MWPCYRLSRQNAVFERFFGRSRSHRVMGNYSFETQKNMFVEHPKMREALAARERGARSLPPKKCEFVFRAIYNFITFRGPEALSTPTPRATPVPVRDPIGLT